MLRKLSGEQRRTIAHWAMEFVVVVAGVLLALWLQELATSANKRSDAKAAEGAIRDELDANLLILVMHDAVADCRRERLQEIEDRLETGEPREPILSNWAITRSQQPKHPAVYGFFALEPVDTAWRSAISNGSSSAMKPERFRSIADLYADFDAIREALAADRDAANELQVLSYPVPLTPELRGRLIKAYYTARANRNFLAEGISTHSIAERMRALGWNDETHLNVLIQNAKRDMTRFGFKLKPCARPLVNPFQSDMRDRSRPEAH